MPSEEGREVLRLLAEKKIDAEQAYRLLAALGDVPKEGEPTRSDDWGRRERQEGQREGRGGGPRVLRIRISEGGQQKVNMAIPLSLARIGNSLAPACAHGRYDPQDQRGMEDSG